MGRPVGRGLSNYPRRPVVNVILGLYDILASLPIPQNVNLVLTVTKCFLSVVFFCFTYFTIIRDALTTETIIFRENPRRDVFVETNIPDQNDRCKMIKRKTFVKLEN